MRTTCAGVRKRGCPPIAAAPAKNLGRLRSHQRRGQDRFGRRPERDEAMVFQQDHPRRARETFDVSDDRAPHRLRELQTGIGVGDEHAFHSATNDLVGKSSALRKLPRVFRAQELVDHDRMGMADKIHARQGQQIRMKDRLHRRFLGVRIRARRKQRLINCRVRQLVSLEQRAAADRSGTQSRRRPKACRDSNRWP